MSPTARTLAHLKSLGYVAGVVERRVQRTICMDFLGCIDIIAVKEGEPPLGIQATSRANHAARRAKSSREPRLSAWLASGATFEVWSWGKAGPRGKRKAWGVWREAVGPADDAGKAAEARAASPRRRPGKHTCGIDGDPGAVAPLDGRCVACENLAGSHVSLERGRTPIISEACESETLCC